MGSKTVGSWSRRDFLEFMGRGSVALSLPVALLGNSKHANASSRAFQAIEPSYSDNLLLSPDLSYSVICKWGDLLNSQGDRFGFNNDFTAFLPISSTEGLLFVNHERPSSIIQYRYTGGPRTLEEVLGEQDSIGASILYIGRSKNSGIWSLKPLSERNRRISARTAIPFSNGTTVYGSNFAQGTLANCSGGVTPWGTVLSCEENYEYYYGEVKYVDGKRELDRSPGERFKWFQHFPNPPEHYGWVVEINPQTGSAKKLVGLGRFAHEVSAVAQANCGKAVVYTGDDREFGRLYKFIADKKGSLDEGRLYAANFDEGRWILLDRNSNEKLGARYATQMDLLINAREAAEIAGATGLDRPEDIDFDPADGSVMICLTKNKSREPSNYYGSLMRLTEQNNDPLAMEFTARTIVAGSKTTFGCPDNMTFDPRGNLWFTTDVSARDIARATKYGKFKNNGLYYVPLHGVDAGNVFQMGSAPVGAQLSGPTFSPDGKTLFVSVFGPGENSKTVDEWTSHWPNGGTALPRPGVVSIYGALLDRLTSVKG